MKKLPMALSDFSTLSQISYEIAKKLIKMYPNARMGEAMELEENFPIRWLMESSNHKFEWVVSEMGSMTLRLAGDFPGKKNPPPIFYLSLGKYEGERFLWETPEGSPIENLEGQIRQLVEEKINLFLRSETESD
ncbi:hypothetical protein EHQ58_15305 [Leptospira ognonensis]|uniref:Uncharacterized protein n=1 Tax=Leptospira ognonensis TaxID=2484945 RepID=A0A4R9JYA1_9LEPT|nr:hypothetical protein [Leptospira ognonensis]TGL57151.1 hypothetical protein EHQ58_15305 [Leptospira ognonensis]